MEKKIIFEIIATKEDSFVKTQKYEMELNFFKINYREFKCPWSVVGFKLSKIRSKAKILVSLIKIFTSNCKRH
jgi:hypothetical protein